MYTCILFVFVFLLLSFALFSSGEKTVLAFLLFPLRLSGIVVAFFGWLSGMFVAGLISDYEPWREVVQEPVRLYSLRSADGVSGAFIAGTGSISSEVQYHFLVESADGSLMPASLPADSTVRIIEDEKLKTEGVWSTTVRERDPTWALRNWSVPSRKYAIRQEFRVPVGTVVHDFNLR